MRGGARFRCCLVSMLSIVAALVSSEQAASAASAEPLASSSGREAHDLSEPPGNAILAVIPFESATPDDQARIMLDIAPAGRTPFIMMLDTGSGSSLITAPLARSMGVLVRQDKISPYRRQTRLGRELLFHIDHDPGDGDSGGPLAYAFLGTDFLKQYVVELDYPGRRVRFFDPERFAVPEQAVGVDERVIAFQLSSDRVLVEIEIHGRSVSALLDTGVPGPVLLSGTAAEYVGIPSAELREFQALHLAAGATRGQITEIDDLRFAGFDFEMTPVLVASQGLYGQAGPMGSLLGYDILRHFVIRIDYPNERIWLRRIRGLLMTLYGFDYAEARERFSFDEPANTPEAARDRRQDPENDPADPLGGQLQDGDSAR